MKLASFRTPQASSYGVEAQRGTTDDLIFDVPAIVAYVSSFTPLVPGDVVAEAA